MFKTIEWSDAIQEINTLLPCCDKLIPDVIADAAEDAGYAVDFIPLVDWESMPDERILRKILPDSLVTSEEIILVTEASYANNGPFIFRESDLAQFIDFHRSQYGECVVNGDVVIIIPSKRTIVLFHHEGVYSTIHCL